MLVFRREEAAGTVWGIVTARIRSLCTTLRLHSRSTPVLYSLRRAKDLDRDPPSHPLVDDLKNQIASRVEGSRESGVVTHLLRFFDQPIVQQQLHNTSDGTFDSTEYPGVIDRSVFSNADTSVQGRAYSSELNLQDMISVGLVVFWHISFVLTGVRRGP